MLLHQFLAILFCLILAETPSFVESGGLKCFGRCGLPRTHSLSLEEDVVKPAIIKENKGKGLLERIAALKSRIKWKRKNALAEKKRIEEEEEKERKEEIERMEENERKRQEEEEKIKREREVEMRRMEEEEKERARRERERMEKLEAERMKEQEREMEEAKRKLKEETERIMKEEEEERKERERKGLEEEEKRRREQEERERIEEEVRRAEEEERERERLIAEKEAQEEEQRRQEKEESDILEAEMKDEKKDEEDAGIQNEGKQQSIEIEGGKGHPDKGMGEDQNGGQVEGDQKAMKEPKLIKVPSVGMGHLWEQSVNRYALAEELCAKELLVDSEVKAIQLGLRDALCLLLFVGHKSPHEVPDDEDSAEKSKVAERGKEQPREDPSGKVGKELFREMLEVVMESDYSTSGDQNKNHRIKMGTFQFVFYSPQAFRLLRQAFDPMDVGLEELIQSLTGAPLDGFINPASSGASFFISADKRFFIKSVDSGEERFFQAWASDTERKNSNWFHGAIWDYYEYLRLRRDLLKESLLPKFYALFSVSTVWKNTKKWERRLFVVMSNVFTTDFPVLHYKFDLKGSTIRRRKLEDDEQQDASGITCRDLDFVHHDAASGRVLGGRFRQGIVLERNQHERVAEILRSDSNFLAAHNIMDYSLLLGVHFVKTGNRATHCAKRGHSAQSTRSHFRPAYALRAHCAVCRDPLDGGSWATAEQPRQLVLGMGIIDILQPYGLIKIGENGVKTAEAWFKKNKIRFFPAHINGYALNSVISPSAYAKRFCAATTEVALTAGEKGDRNALRQRKHLAPGEETEQRRAHSVPVEQHWEMDNHLDLGNAQLFL